MGCIGDGEKNSAVKRRRQEKAEIVRENAHQVSLVKEYPEDRIIKEELFDDFQFSPPYRYYTFKCWRGKGVFPPSFIYPGPNTCEAEIVVHSRAFALTH